MSATDTRSTAASRPIPRSLVAASPAMRHVLALVHRMAASDLTVLILGESGTGKELIARAIHAGSPRNARTLVTVNCAALPETLIESELFGHERGAFTGALVRKPGRFELAHGGTLFLDEIAELAPAMQAKLLRALQEREIERLGGRAPVRVDVRILAATNKDLPRLVREGTFRDDLYYRLNVLALAIPPLRARREDIMPLAQHFLDQHGRRPGQSPHRFTPEALALLRRHDWPGNVRELEHAVQRAAILAHGDEIRAGDLGLQLEAGDRVAEAPVRYPTLADVERDRILTTLQHHRGQRALAARALGISRTTLWRRLARWRAAP